MQRPIKQLEVRSQVLRDPPLSDPLGDGRPRSFLELPAAADIAMQHTPRRIGQERLHAAVRHRFQIPGHAGQRTAGAGGAGKSVDGAVRLGPDLWAGRLDMGAAIGHVIELVGPHGIVDALGMSLGLMIVVLWILVRYGGDRVDFGAEQT